MLNLNFNSRQPNFGGQCSCSGTAGLPSMSSAGSQMMMMNMVVLSLMNTMNTLMQMLAGGIGVTGGPAQFGGHSGASPLGNFLGGGSSAAAPSDYGPGGHNGGSVFPTGPVGRGNVDPSSVKDQSSTQGINGAARRGLDEAHRFGLPLVSGKRSGSGKSDHDHGNAIDVGTLPIGAASSTGGTPQMKQYAEYMRQQGKAGRGNVKYIIADGRIASSKNNWEWRPYTYPGKSQSELNRIKQTNRGEYNRLQHFDHVHVSFK